MSCIICATQCEAIDSRKETSAGISIQKLRAYTQDPKSETLKDSKNRAYTARTLQWGYVLEK